MGVVLTLISSSHKDISSDWVDQDILKVVSYFFRVGTLDHTFIDVGPSF